MSLKDQHVTFVESLLGRDFATWDGKFPRKRIDELLELHAKELLEALKRPPTAWRQVQIKSIVDVIHKWSRDEVVQEEI